MANAVGSWITAHAQVFVTAYIRVMPGPQVRTQVAAEVSAAVAIAVAGLIVVFSPAAVVTMEAHVRTAAASSKGGILEGPHTEIVFAAVDDPTTHDIPGYKSTEGLRKWALLEVEVNEWVGSEVRTAAIVVVRKEGSARQEL